MVTMTSKWSRRRSSLAEEHPSRYQHKHLMLLASKALDGGADGLLPASRTTLPHEGFSARNLDWINVQHAVVSLFQQKKLGNLELVTLYENVRNLVKSDVGPFIYDYYKNQLVKRGMAIIRENVNRNEGTGRDMVNALEQTWTYFFQEILPTLQAILHPIQTKDLSVRQVTLLGFRDYVVFHFPLEVELLSMQSHKDTCISGAMEQMLLILQNVRESDIPSERYLRLESLVALAVSPYLGYRGLYMGGPDPIFLSSELKSVNRVRSKGRAESLQTRPSSLPLEKDDIPAKSTNYVEQRTRTPSTLETLTEVAHSSSSGSHYSGARRHSLNVTFVT